MHPMDVARRLSKRGFEVFIVGGAVRDSLSGISPKDIDLVTNARPDEIADVFADVRTRDVGRAFGVMLVGDLQIEVATYRKDRYAGFDHKNVEVTFADDVEEDLSRRDLTINAMAMDLNGKLVDMFNGQSDLRSRLIRFVGDANDRINEDPNRMIRACRFRSKIQGRFEDSTKAALQSKANIADKFVAKERLRLEVLKAMSDRRASIFFFSLLEVGLLKLVFPALFRCVDHPHGKYHLEDVFTHSMLTGDSLTSRCPYLKLAGYLHDVGKPIQAEIDDEGNMTFYNHEHAGADAVEADLRRLMFSKREADYVAALTRFHMRTLKKVGPKAIRKLLRDLRENDVPYIEFLRLKFADHQANLMKEPMTLCTQKAMVRRIEEFTDLQDVNSVTKLSQLSLNGDDVMRIMGISPGKAVGAALNSLMEAVDDGLVNNEKEELEHYLREVA